MEMKQFLKRTPGGLVLRNYIRRLTPDLFTWENDHNPTVARHCEKCDGKGFYRIGLGAARHDETCSDCGGIGGFEDPSPYFTSTATPYVIAPSASGSLQCPACKRIFPVTSNQYWSGLRHSCGQKIILKGPHAELCWRKAYDKESNVLLSSVGGPAIASQAALQEEKTPKPWWKVW